MANFIAHTVEGIKYFDSEMDAHMESNSTTSSHLVTLCGVVLGLDLNYSVIEAMTVLAQCPCREECLDHSMDLIREYREQLNKSLSA